MPRIAAVMFLVACNFPLPAAEPDADWPQWHGPNRAQVWAVRNLPALPKEVPALWRKPIGGGFGGVAVARGRVFVLDRQKTPREVERVLCMDLDTGETKWVREYPVKYAGLDYGIGPRATPTVYDGRVYTFGAVGHLHCLDAKTGDVIWSHDCKTEFKATLPTWGLASSPLIDGDRVVVQAGGADACVIAFDRTTGKVGWKALNDRAGYTSPVRIEVGANKLLVAWTAENINALDAESGKVLWSVPFYISYDVAIADPVWHAGVLLCGQYWEGSKALTLDANGLNPTVAWESKKLRLLMSTPLVRDGFAYALDWKNGVSCVDLKTGAVKWDGFKVSTDARNPHAALTWTGDGEVLALNDKGELIRAKLSPQKFEELGRMKIFGGSWAHPAFARGRVVVRDDHEIVCVRLTGPTWP
jgi:outer membrane protein assembly factor BamB